MSTWRLRMSEDEWRELIDEEALHARFSPRMPPDLHQFLFEMADYEAWIFEGDGGPGALDPVHAELAAYGWRAR